MKFENCQPLDEIFTHVGDDGKVMHINVTEMQRYINRAVDRPAGVIAVLVEVELGFAQFIRRRRGVEQWKLDRLHGMWLERPLIGVGLPDGTTLTVDGHHRYVRLAEMGRTELKYFLFALGSWERFLVEDMPDIVNDWAVKDTLDQL